MVFITHEIQSPCTMNMWNSYIKTTHIDAPQVPQNALDEILIFWEGYLNEKLQEQILWKIYIPTVQVQNESNSILLSM